jgi:hypothetical protein
VEAFEDAGGLVTSSSRRSRGGVEPLAVRLILVLLLLLPSILFVQAAQRNRTFVISGHPGELTVREMDGQGYIEIEALARLTNGSLTSSGDRIVLTISGFSSDAPAAATLTNQHSSMGFTKEFLKAAIEQMSAVREWRSTLINAVQRGFPVTGDWMNGLSNEAQHHLRLVSVAASSEEDRKAVQLLTNEFNNMKKLSDRFVEANKSRSYVAPNALDNDPLDQRILNCAHSLSAMAANNQFVDEGFCH